MNLTRLLKYLHIHPSKHKKHLAICSVTNLMIQLSNHKINGQVALKKCLPIADKFNITKRWEKDSHILESSIYANLYRLSIHSETRTASKNKDRIAWYYLRKYNQPFISINKHGNWLPFKHQFQFDKALSTLKNLIINA